MNEDRLISDFAYYLKIERGMSPNTVASYRSDIDALFNFFAERNFAERNRAARNITAKNIQKDDILEYLSESRQERDVSKRSQAREISSMRSFFSWMRIEGLRIDDPMDGIEQPKLGIYLPDVLSVEEVSSIINSTDSKTWIGLRDRAILEVLYGCGLRVSEVSSLPISEIYFTEGFIRIIGKGNKQRLVPFGDMAREAVEKYMEVRPRPASSDYDDILFLNRFGKSLSRVSIFKTVKKQASLAGIQKEVSPHTFRHSFATHLIENGADLRAVQEMLGHESILTTEIYTHVDSSKWHDTIIKHHPRN